MELRHLVINNITCGSVDNKVPQLHTTNVLTATTNNACDRSHNACWNMSYPTDKVFDWRVLGTLIAWAFRTHNINSKAIIVRKQITSCLQVRNFQMHGIQWRGVQTSLILVIGWHNACWFIAKSIMRKNQVNFSPPSPPDIDVELWVLRSVLAQCLSSENFLFE